VVLGGGQPGVVQLLGQRSGSRAAQPGQCAAAPQPQRRRQRGRGGGQVPGRARPAGPGGIAGKRQRVDSARAQPQLIAPGDGGKQLAAAPWAAGL